jgi:membrane protein implicated in regulation of membrane protease activity
MIVNLILGVSLLIAGIAALALELAHPGALLFIPGSALIVGGVLELFVPSYLIDNLIGGVAIVVAAAVAGLIEIPYYRWVAPTHKPMTSTSKGFTGEFATVTVAIVPNTLKGKVRIGSEIWSAQADYPIPAGTRVRVVDGSGVSVRVVVEPPPQPAS